MQSVCVMAKELCSTIGPCCHAFGLCIYSLVYNALGLLDMWSCTKRVWPSGYVVLCTKGWKALPYGVAAKSCGTTLIAAAFTPMPTGVLAMRHGAESMKSGPAQIGKVHGD